MNVISMRNYDIRSVVKYSNGIDDDYSGNNQSDDYKRDSSFYGFVHGLKIRCFDKFFQIWIKSEQESD